MAQNELLRLHYLTGLSGRTRVALEPTGDFHRPRGCRLLQAGFEVVSISSAAQARFREALYGTWDKNDPKDARDPSPCWLTAFVQTYYDPLFHGTHDLARAFKHVLSDRPCSNSASAYLLLHYLPLYFPSLAATGIQHAPSAVRALTQDDFIREA